MIRAFVTGPDPQSIAFLQLSRAISDRLPIAIPSHITPGRGDFVGLVAYPSNDGRMPLVLQTALLQGQPGVKRLMPGRIVKAPSLDVRDSALVADPDDFVTDVSSSAGAAGGPLIDLKTGELLGLHYGGRWCGIEKGKHAFARSTFALSKEYNPLKIFTPEFEFQFKRDAEARVAAFNEFSDLGKSKFDPEDPSQLSAYDPSFLSGDPIPLPVLRAEPAASGGEGVQLLDYVHFTTRMHKSRKVPIYAILNLDGESLLRLPRPRGKRLPDPRLSPDKQVSEALFNDNPIDQGDLVHRLSVTWGDHEQAARAANATFYWTNTTPQHSSLNQGSWTPPKTSRIFGRFVIRFWDETARIF